MTPRDLIRALTGIAAFLCLFWALWTITPA
jgi:hypothetical protein